MQCVAEASKGAAAAGGVPALLAAAAGTVALSKVSTRIAAVVAAIALLGVRF